MYENFDSGALHGHQFFFVHFRCFEMLTTEGKQTKDKKCFVHISVVTFEKLMFLHLSLAAVNFIIRRNWTKRNSLTKTGSASCQSIFSGNCLAQQKTKPRDDDPNEKTIESNRKVTN